MADATISLRLTSAEFDLLRTELADQAEQLIQRAAPDPKKAGVQHATERRGYRERAAQISEMLNRLS